MKRRQFLRASAGVPAALVAAPPVQAQSETLTPPPLVREFRGLWVATVTNIDWPSKPGLPREQQQQELVGLLDRAVRVGLNAVLLQVRPACDALYESEREPWSEYLTGTMGQHPGYDPLAFAVAEAHRRGLELHAWVNPFRARQGGAKGALAPNHIKAKHPELVRSYGSLLWLDPGEEQARRHSLDVLLDIVRRYDIDGLHLDDYFYPYKIWIDEKAKKEQPFPDSAPWGRYVQGGGKLSRADWRRENINLFVQELYGAIKTEKPHVKFGISPFGIWRPGHPPQIQGYDAYENLYGDSRKWLQEGWGDYFAPQLYWKIDQAGQSFPILLIWWGLQNKQNRHLWPGLYTSKYSPLEIEYQIRVTRGLATGPGIAPGNLHFSAVALRKGDETTNDNMAGHLIQSVYADSAVVPACPWLSGETPSGPRAVRIRESSIVWTPSDELPPSLWAVQWLSAGVWRTAVLPGAQLRFDAPGAVDAAGVTAVNRFGNTSPTVAGR